MRIVLIGAVESTAVTFQALCEHGVTPVAVFGLLPELGHRHSDLVDIAGMADAMNVPFVGVRSINDADVVARIEALDPDWLIVVGWSQICGERLLAVPRVGSIGYHPSALPKLRGRAVLAWTILLGLKRTAGTLFSLAPGVDSGDILAQHAFDLDERETLPSLIAKHMAALRSMWAEIMPRLAAPLPGMKQDDGKASYCAKRTAADGLIDWSREAVDIDRLIRAVTHPYPGAFGWLRGSKLTIWEATIWAGPTYHGSPGQIVARHEQGLVITCANGTALLATKWDWPDLASRNGKVPVGERIVLAQ